MKLKIGDIVCHTHWGEKYVGIVKKIHAVDRVQVDWYLTEDTTEHKVGFCWDDYHMTTKYLVILKEAPRPTKEEKVLTRIQFLWNNSKYVENNPKAAY